MQRFSSLVSIAVALIVGIDVIAVGYWIDVFQNRIGELLRVRCF